MLTGSVNQASVESGMSDAGRALLAKAQLADVVMAPAADMFQMGVKVQVLKRGTLLALFVIFAMMAIPLQSYAQPLIIMMAIPFGLIGAIAKYSPRDWGRG